MIINIEHRDSLTQFEKKLIQTSLLLDKIIAFPTDTIYGFGVNGFSKKAVENLFNRKGRSNEKPLILLTDTIEKVFPFILGGDDCVFNATKKYWPGPYTLILPFKTDSSLCFSVHPSKTIGVRIPNHILLQDLLSFLPFPIVTTSANISGENPCIDGTEIEKTLNGDTQSLGIILDQGNLDTKSPSTILEFKNGEFVTLLDRTHSVK